MPGYDYQRFPYRRPPELAGGPVVRRPVAIVGAGPVGLAAAIDLAIHGIPSVVLDDNDVVSIGSRAICWAKRTLEIFDRLGVGDRMVAKGVTWKVGRVFAGEREIDTVDLLPEPGHKMPAFINLQQYYVEQYLVERAGEFRDLIDLRWKNKVVAIAPEAEGARLFVETPDGPYTIAADWVLAADGARSTLRSLLGLSFDGQLFEERFLIVDVRLPAERPNERHFWFRPVFDPSESVLIHRQPDNVYRIDFQLGPEADPASERQPDRIRARVEAAFGPGVAYELDWSSVYTFRCARMDCFIHGRVVFVGDSAHVVSPFGARGGNGGIQDVDNLCWKLAAVVRGDATPELLASYEAERGRGADENILNSARTTRFMTPRSTAERAFRDGVLALARTHAFARRLVNGGRLSQPCSLAGLPLQTNDIDTFPGGVAPGRACLDAPLLDAAGQPTWLLRALGPGFTLLLFGGSPADALGAASLPDGITLVVITTDDAKDGHPAGAQAFVDIKGYARDRYAAAPGTAYLIRPDQHVAARVRRFDPAVIADAHARACARHPRSSARAS